ncbi:hypothetical protein B0H67DRAFT_645078 [Lasiosphaeris hirsuta]|uniref:Uncharacterized protein n=1 Tax=Lasiosphaeris hirsuta TaxID=260670 RepID=A0AA40DTV0_9PEZI|nr:hypothetical protein B0H67DRAFT_645078 [Lasiosphaeris hirsuta]
MVALTALVQRWLSDERDRRWLLVLENYDSIMDGFQVRDLMPSTAWGSIIITTQTFDLAMQDLEGNAREDGGYSVRFVRWDSWDSKGRMWEFQEAAELLLQSANLYTGPLSTKPIKVSPLRPRALPLTARLTWYSWTKNHTRTSSRRWATRYALDPEPMDPFWHNRAGEGGSSFIRSYRNTTQSMWEWRAALLRPEAAGIYWLRVGCGSLAVQISEGLIDVFFAKHSYKQTESFDLAMSLDLMRNITRIEEVHEEHLAIMEEYFQLTDHFLNSILSKWKKSFSIALHDSKGVRIPARPLLRRLRLQADVFLTKLADLFYPCARFFQPDWLNLSPAQLHPDRSVNHDHKRHSNFLYNDGNLTRAAEWGVRQLKTVLHQRDRDNSPAVNELVGLLLRDLPGVAGRVGACKPRDVAFLIEELDMEMRAAAGVYGVVEEMWEKQREAPERPGGTQNQPTTKPKPNTMAVQNNTKPEAAAPVKELVSKEAEWTCGCGHKNSGGKICGACGVRG